MGIKFVLYTDHAALTYLQSSASISRRNARWLDFLSQFQFTIVHIKGRENVVADALSRVPGSEVLSTAQLCSVLYTLGIYHVDEQIMCDSCNIGLNNVITIHENKTFLKQLLLEQQQSKEKWFMNKLKLAQNGSVEY